MTAGIVQAGWETLYPIRNFSIRILDLTHIINYNELDKGLKTQSV